MKYRRKVQAVQAVQWLGTPESADNVHLLAGTNFQIPDDPWDGDPGDDAICLSDLDGGRWMPMRIGDYVVVDDEGQLFPLRQARFEELYEPVE